METITLTFDENNKTAVALVEYIKTLDFIEIKYDDEVKAATEELISTMLERAEITIEDINDRALKIWISKNLDLLTEEEIDKYKKLGILLL